jgi:hypothetical protein
VTVGTGRSPIQVSWAFARSLVVITVLMLLTAGAWPVAGLAGASAADASVTAAPQPFPPGSYGIATARRGQFLELWSGPSNVSRPLFLLWPRDVWGGPTTLSVLAVKGAWIEGLAGSVQSDGPARFDNVPVWVPRDEVVLSWTRYRIDISLSAHRLWLVHAGRAIASWVVGSGAPSSPTPTGRFALVDKVPGARFGRAYGCCALGLSALEKRGALAGGQVAIHGTDRTASIPQNVSNGCVHGTDAMLHELSRRVPLGAPVFITR